MNTDTSTQRVASTSRRRRRGWTLAAGLVLAGGLSWGAPLTTATAAPARTLPAPCGVARSAHYDHVVWILLENVGYSVVGAPDAPYLNTLMRACGLATQDYGVAHPSLPNYIALTSGSTQGISDDAEPSAHHLAVANIFTQLRGRWRTYAESMPTPCDHVTSGVYAARHNPAVYYTNLTDCAQRDVPLRGALDLSAAFTMIVPNVCDDLHSCPVTNGDAWLRQQVPAILASREYRAHSLALFITFDENTQSASNRIPTVVIAPTVPRGTRVGITLTHYSLLRTTETLLHLPLLGGARSASSLLGPFHL